MSSIPGYTLEDFIKWRYNLVVDNTDEANFSLGLAEKLGTSKVKRLVWNQETFKKFMAIFEHGREYIEDRLLDFDDETQSWRSYGSGIAEYFDTPEIDKKVKDFYDSLNPILPLNLFIISAPDGEVIEHFTFFASTDEEIEECLSHIKPLKPGYTSILYKGLHPKAAEGLDFNAVKPVALRVKFDYKKG